MKNENVTRRAFIEKTTKATLAFGITSSVLPAIVGCSSTKLAAGKIPTTGYTQQPLPYSYKDLMPSIDAETMELHYSKHAASYAKNLAEAVSAEGINTSTTSIEELLSGISKYSAKMRNNGGGHYNHELFWKCMAPASQSSKPEGELMSSITRDFGSFETFVTQFSDAAKNRFGSGWAWLVTDNDKKLRIGSTPNQDNPLMNVSEFKGIPLLGLDVWEHAYYLKYQNKRPDYITNWWKIVNWKYVGERFKAV